ncbi:hypothetical protein QN277_007457 [Acacia crassicarpa]|uniref:Uncharacterized protein n=1 Tax=Acacia crassicarpa TaxID=499986 RepID=A0AAE1MA01_9FABA|nr:hypothetical protein QN277_007457 [Acacia crassicarpa]
MHKLRNSITASTAPCISDQSFMFGRKINIRVIPRARIGGRKEIGFDLTKLRLRKKSKKLEEGSARTRVLEERSRRNQPSQSSFERNSKLKDHVHALLDQEIWIFISGDFPGLL